MKATLDIPDDLAEQVQRRAAADGRALADQVVELLRKGLAVPSTPAPLVTTDPQTGLPVIHSPAGSPISRMTAQEIDALIQQTQEEEDLERFRISLRR